MFAINLMFLAKGIFEIIWPIEKFMQEQVLRIHMSDFQFWRPKLRFCLCNIVSIITAAKMSYLWQFCIIMPLC